MAVQRAETLSDDPRSEGAESSEPAERESNTNRAYREIRRRILMGEMPPGDQYLEQELAEMLGMSRTPVREALIRLADERLVEVRPRHGARVLPVSIADILEIYELLAELESLAVRRLAAKGATPAQLAAAQDAQHQMAAALQAGERTAWYAADCAFHAGLVAACGNDRLIDVVRGLTDQAHWARQRTIERYEIGDRSDREHAEIVTAIKTHDAETAGRLVRQHRAYGGAAMAELLKTAAEKR
jgi:DNA-binding GntR family transcriptional regulator